VFSLRFLGDLAMSSVRMVNTGFRSPAHGFELVDARPAASRMPASIENLRDRDRRRILRQIFRELSGRQSLAIYRELLGRWRRAEIAVGQI
jgi:hypothetical protein